MIYLQPWWHSWLQNLKKKKIGVGYCNGQPWLWLAAEDMLVPSVSLWDIYSKCVFVYIMCMRATIVYIYLCDCIGIFECEAHFNMIIVPASVCGGVTKWWRALLVSQSGGLSWWVLGREFGTGGDPGGGSESVGCVLSHCRPEPDGKLGWAVIWWSEDSHSRPWPFAWPGRARPALWTPAESHWRGSALTPPWQKVAMV